MENLLSDAEMEAVIDGDHGNVFAVLGIHRDKGSKNVFIRAFQPHAKSIEVIGRDGVSRGMMNRLDERGFSRSTSAPATIFPTGSKSKTTAASFTRRKTLTGSGRRSATSTSIS